MPELKPCPFCGGEAEVQEREGRTRDCRGDAGLPQDCALLPVPLEARRTASNAMAQGYNHFFLRDRIRQGDSRADGASLRTLA